MKRALFSLRDAGDSPRRALSLALASIAAVVGPGSARAVEACTAASTRVNADTVLSEPFRMRYATCRLVAHASGIPVTR